MTNGIINADEKLKILVEYVRLANKLNIDDQLLAAAIEYLEMFDWDAQAAANQFNSEWDYNEHDDGDQLNLDK